jgi:hemolysin III
MVSWARAVTKHITVEELPNALTHGFGLLCSILGFVVLLAITLIRGGKWQLISCAIYGVTLICVYAASTLYHGVSSPRWKKGFLLFDHCAIYLLIAGTYTPFLLVNLRGGWGWPMFGLIWGIAVSGVLFKLLFADRFPILSVALYLGMGWLGIVAAKEVYIHVPSIGLLWIFAGALAYSVGVIFYACKKIPHHHVIWHLLVMAGSGCHYIAILYSVFPPA